MTKEQLIQWLENAVSHEGVYPVKMASDEVRLILALLKPIPQNECDCGAAIDGKWTGKHSPECATISQPSCAMSDEQFKTFLELLMCSDPWPMNVGQDLMAEFADDESRSRGFADWIAAYHEFDR